MLSTSFVFGEGANRYVVLRNGDTTTTAASFADKFEEEFQEDENTPGARVS